MACFENRPIHFYFERKTEERFDLEMIFWPDLMFGDCDEAQREALFRRLVQFALDACERGEGKLVRVGREAEEGACVIWERNA